MCGILGLCLADPNGNAAPELFDGAMFLQHRGQDAAGIVTCGVHGRLYQCKGNGMAKDVFTESRLKGLVGNMGLVHLRYPTAGSSANSEAQPFYVNSPYGISLSHNGNLVNAPDLRKYLDEVVHRHINTDSDSELLINIFASELEKYDKRRVNVDDLFHALGAVYRLCRGAYACTGLLAGYAVIGFRDPHGIRPLLIGERQNENGTVDYMLSSESVVLDAHGFKKWKDIKPGQAVVIPKDTMKPVYKQIVEPKSYTPDIFEYVYFARPDSVQDGMSVYRARLAMGEKLADTIIESFGGKEKMLKEIDVVIPVPDTARTSALEAAGRLGLKYREGFVKNRYVGRTFIMPDQALRRSSVRRKLNAMEIEFKGRNVLLVDDSIVRGTTSKEIIQMAKDAGANKVYFASCSPPIRHNHIYGIDLADSRALVAHGRNEEEIATEIGADKVIYQKLDDLITACSRGDINKFEVGVFTGKYVTGDEEGYLKELERIRAINQRINKQKTSGHIIDILDDPKAQVDIGLYNSGDYL